METLNTTITTLAKTCQQTLTNPNKNIKEDFTVLQQSIEKIGSTIQQLSERSRPGKPFGTPLIRQNSNSKTS